MGGARGIDTAAMSSAAHFVAPEKGRNRGDVLRLPLHCHKMLYKFLHINRLISGGFHFEKSCWVKQQKIRDIPPEDSFVGHADSIETLPLTSFCLLSRCYHGGNLATGGLA